MNASIKAIAVRDEARRREVFSSIISGPTRRSDETEMVEYLPRSSMFGADASSEGEWLPRAGSAGDIARERKNLSQDTQQAIAANGFVQQGEPTRYLLHASL